jgi:NADH dehydrogenase [ubiquinone] 1 alpha subcomplex assembly factor 1
MASPALTARAPASAAATRSTTPVFTFDEGDDSSWNVVNDGVMGGVSSSTARIANGVMVFSGRVRLENNGGFASVRAGVDETVDSPLASSRSVVLRVKGDGRPYEFTMQAADGSAWFWARIQPSAGKWTTIEIPYAALRPHGRFGDPIKGPSYDGRPVESIGFLISNKKAERFRIEVDWVALRA